MDVICYACGRGENPENTIEGIQHCQNVNSDWRIEMDLQLSKDWQIILFHDDTTERTTGVKNRVAELTLTELKKLNAGYNFKIENEFPFRNDSLQIPTLKEVFTLYPKAKFVLDVHSDNKAIVDKAIAIIEQYGKENTIVIVSKFDHILFEFKRKRSNWVYGAATKEVKNMVYCSFLFLDKFYPIQSDILMLPVKYGNLKLLTKRVLKHVRNREKKIWVWIKEGKEVQTVASKEEFMHLKNKSVDGVFTEYPKKINKEME